MNYVQPLYVLLPALVANMAPVIMKKQWNGLAIPLDRLFKHEVFGSHKTVRGFVAGVVFAVLVSLMQFLVQETSFGVWMGTDHTSWLVRGVLFGFGALVGDAVKSMIKRKRGVAPGRRFFPWDQCDFVLGAIAFGLPFWTFSLIETSITVVVTIGLHIVVNHIAYWLRIRDEAW